jgi:hypothetical protein
MMESSLTESNVAPISLNKRVGSMSSAGDGSLVSMYHDAVVDEQDFSQSDDERSLSPEENRRQRNLQSKHCLPRARQHCGDLVNHNFVQLGVIGLICINAIMMAIATFDFVTDVPRVARTFEKCDLAFLIVFTIELSMQFFYYGLRLFQDGWLVFDFVIIVLSWAFNEIQVIRAFRVFRAFRIVTRVKALRDLVMAIIQVLPRMTAIGFLLLLVFYVFSVLFVELFGELDLSENYFQTLDASLFTCMQMMTMEWANAARECQETYSWAPFVFVAFIMITGFIVFNLIIAVVCDAVAVAERMGRAADDDDSDELLSPEEMLYCAQGQMDSLGNQISGLMDREKDLQDLLELLGSEIRQLEESKS